MEDFEIVKSLLLNQEFLTNWELIVKVYFHLNSYSLETTQNNPKKYFVPKVQLKKDILCVVKTTLEISPTSMCTQDV